MLILTTYGHQSSGPLSESVSLHAELCVVVSPAVDVPVVAVSDGRGVQMPIADVAREATFVPRLKIWRT